jgi:lysophospholipase L1-like esterase
MRTRVVPVVVVAVVCVIVLLTGEGLFAIVRWDHSDRSILYKTFALFGRDAQAEMELRPAGTHLAGRAEFAAAMPAFHASKVGLGNTDYGRMNADTVNYRLENGCRSMKADIRKVMSSIHSVVFEPFDPPMLFVNEVAFTGAVAEFVKTYGEPPFRFSTNAQSERVTLPLVEADRKVLIAGDSVAAGVGIDDANTMSSQLQQRDATRQYINLGIGGAEAKEIVCGLLRAIERYRGSVDELIYVYCANDLNPELPYGTPEETMDWLMSFVAEESIPKVTVVYAPFIYDVMPQLTRFRGYKGERYSPHYVVGRILKERAKAAGFRFLNISDLAAAERATYGTQFASFMLFVDEVHLSPYGTRRLVEKLRQPS